jgi:hypothetical protein
VRARRPLSDSTMGELMRGGTAVLRVGGLQPARGSPLRVDVQLVPPARPNHWECVRNGLLTKSVDNAETDSQLGVTERAEARGLHLLHLSVTSLQAMQGMGCLTAATCGCHVSAPAFPGLHRLHRLRAGCFLSVDSRDGVQADGRASHGGPLHSHCSTQQCASHASGVDDYSGGRQRSVLSASLLTACSLTSPNALRGHLCHSITQQLSAAGVAALARPRESSPRSSFC